METNSKGLYKKILKTQGEIGTVLKDSVNPFFKSKYADINAFIEMIKPIITDNGLIILQPLVYVTNPISGIAQPCIKTILIDSDDGVSFQSVTPMTDYPDAQKAGSTITYFRRYALQSLLLIQTEDDDGSKKQADPKNQKGFTALIKAINESDKKTLEDYKKKMDKSNKYTTAQKKEFAKAVDKRLNELKKKL